jgi:hypothetical protein
MYMTNANASKGKLIARIMWNSKTNILIGRELSTGVPMRQCSTVSCLLQGSFSPDDGGIWPSERLVQFHHVGFRYIPEDISLHKCLEISFVKMYTLISSTNSRFVPLK